MNDPHVAALKYRLILDESLEFRDPPDLEIDTPQFSGRLSNGLLTLELKEHFETESQIKPLADGFVRAWEIEAGLQYGPRVHFRFEGSHLVDRKAKSGTLELSFGNRLSLSGSAIVKLGLLAYPDPPRNFKVTPVVDLLWTRYCRYTEDREPLQSAAFFCYSVLKVTAGSNRKAAQQFRIQEKVLTKLRELSSERGDKLTARKLTPRTTPLSGEEKNWIECAIKAIIRHLATRPAGITLAMKDLPPL
jgi:hypothetical protein